MATKGLSATTASAVRRAHSLAVGGQLLMDTDSRPKQGVADRPAAARRFTLAVPSGDVGFSWPPLAVARCPLAASQKGTKWSSMHYETRTPEAKMPFPDDGEPGYARRPGESARAFAAWVSYRDLPAGGRS